MRKMYTGLKAEKVDFGRYDMVTLSCGTMPDTCNQIVADQVIPGDNKCNNPPSTIQYMWFGDSPNWCDED